MHIRISRVEEHTTREQRIVDGVGETRRPIRSVTLEFKFEGGWPTIKDRVGTSRAFGILMDDGHTYHIRDQFDGFAWVRVTYVIRPANANPYNAATTDELKERALAAIKRKVDGLTQ